jgi:acyl carrier protein
MSPLRGVIHAAGLLDDGVLRQLTWERFPPILAPKAIGAWLLDRFTAADPLDFFIMFSSVAAVIGAPGQANYAAANAFLDALAHHRRRRGRPALAVAWAPWAGTGMGAANLSEARRRAASGLAPIPPQSGLEVLELLLRQDATAVAVLPIDWSVSQKDVPPGAEPPLLADLIDEGRARAGAETSPAVFPDLAQRMAAAEPEARKGIVETFLREQAFKVLAVDPTTSLDPHQPLSDLGLDSLMAVELRNILARSLGRTLPATLLFDYPTLDALSKFLTGERRQAQEPPDGGGEPEINFPQHEAIIAEISKLSEDEVATSIARELAEVLRHD